MPDFLDTFLKNGKYRLIEILQINKRKDTYILKIQKESHYFILKAYTENSPEDIQKRFEKERDFYIDNRDCTLIPKLSFYKDSILIFEYFESTTIRDYLKNNNQELALVESLTRALNMFQEKIKKESKSKKAERHYFDNIFIYIKTLSNSYPQQAKDVNISKIDRILNKLISMLLIYKVSNRLKRVQYYNFSRGFAHLDLHYNNILINKNLEIKFIDFENIRYEGYFIFDILYLIVIIEIFLENDESKQKLRDYLHVITLNDKVTLQIYEVFKIASMINKKFQKNTTQERVSKIEKIILIFNIIKNLKNKAANV